MADTSALITLDSIVDQILLLSDDMPERMALKLKQLAIRGYRELNLITIPQGKNFAWTAIDSNYMIALDDEVVSVNDVFVPINGLMWSLSRRKDIVPTFDTTLDSDRGEGVDIVPIDGTGLASSGGNNKEGYYYYDEKNRRLIFRNVSQLTEVLLDFNTSGVSLTTETYVPSYAEGALTAYIMRELERFKAKTNANNLIMWDDEFKAQKAICRSTQFNFTEFKDAIFSTFTPSFRRSD